jgi:hypothetical protein
VKAGLSRETLIHADRSAELAKQAGRIDLWTIRSWVDALEEWIEATDRNVAPMLALHEMLTRIGSAAPAPTPAPPAGGRRSR